MSKAPVLAHVLARAVHAELLRRRFLAFLEYFFAIVTGRAYEPNAITVPIVDALQDVGDGRCTKLIVNKPPGTGLSTIETLFHGWNLARDPSWKAITASHSYELSATTSRRVRRLLESPEFQRLFAVRLRDDESTVAHWATEKDGRFYAVGRDSGVTGIRASLVFGNDLNAVADRYSAAALDHAYRFATETLSTRLDHDRAAMIVSGQRVAATDVTGRLLELGGWRHVSIPAEDEDGNPMAPRILPREKLEDLRKQIGSAAYVCQYMGRVVDDSASMFKRDWLTRRYTELPERFDRVVIALDASFKAGSSSDHAVLQAWGSYKADRLLLEQWRRQAGFADTLAAVKAMRERWPLAKVLVEAAANGHAILDQLCRELPGCVDVKPEGGKVARAASVQAIVESGAVVLPANAPWLDTWLDEVTAFPNAKHDDQVDAMVYALRELASGVTAGNPTYFGGFRIVAPADEVHEADRYVRS